jgi:predicted XRE-type DNA-binding protein
MFRVKYTPFGNHELPTAWGTLTWPGELPGELGTVYDELTAEKRRRLRGDGDDGDGFVKADEAAQTAEQAAEQAERQKRDELLREIYHNTDGMTQQELADSVGLSRSRIADILSESN